MLRHLTVFTVCFPLFFAAYLLCLHVAAGFATRGDAERARREQADWRRRAYAEAERTPERKPAAAGPARRADREDPNVESARRAAACDGHNCVHDVRPEVRGWVPYSAP